MNLSFLLEKYKIKANIEMLLEMWNEPQRSYHNLDHLSNLREMIVKDFIDGKITEKIMEKLLLTSLFHDIIYDPTRKDNELKSSEFFMSVCLEKQNTDILEINQAILDTATHVATIPLSEKFNIYDMNIVERDYDSLLKWESGIFEEFSFASDYKERRLRFLESIVNKYPLNSSNLTMLIEFVKNKY